MKYLYHFYFAIRVKRYFSDLFLVIFIVFYFNLFWNKNLINFVKHLVCLLQSIEAIVSVPLNCRYGEYCREDWCLNPLIGKYCGELLLEIDFCVENFISFVNRNIECKNIINIWSNVQEVYQMKVKELKSWGVVFFIGIDCWVHSHVFNVQT